MNSARSNFLIWDARGSVGRDQSTRLRRNTAAGDLLLSPRIMVTHYPLDLADGRPEHHWRRVRDWKAIQRIASEEGIALWLHGHRHSGYVLPPSPPDRPFPVICAGSATQLDRWAYNIYTIDGEEFRIERRPWNPGEGRFFAGNCETVISLNRVAATIDG